MEIFPVRLPEEIPGALFLSSLPGREGTLAADLEAIRALRVDWIVNLAEREECEQQSPDYLSTASLSGQSWRWTHLPIPANSIPADRSSLLHTVEELADLLWQGRRILIHCSGGVGRSGSVAILVLLKIGLPLMDASIRVADAGSGLESPEQETLIEIMSQYWQQPRSLA